MDGPNRTYAPPRRQLPSPLISVVIPVYNRAALIGKTISSCLKQSYRPLEVIVVDDCSSDDLASALSPFVDDERVRLVSHEHNQGVSAARNSGVRAARGDYVAFLDSDDEWKPAKLEKQMELVRSDGGQAILCGTMTEVWAHGRVKKVRPKRCKPKDISIGDYLFVHKVYHNLPQVNWSGAPLVEGCFAQTSSFLLPRDLTLATPFRTTLNQYEDLAFLVDLDQKGVTFLLVEEPMTMQDDDDRPGRLGARDDVERGQRFLDEVGNALSDDARLGFEVTHLAHRYARERPIHVAWLVLRAYVRGLIATRSVLGILTRSLLGQATQKEFRDRLLNRHSASRNQETETT